MQLLNIAGHGEGFAIRASKIGAPTRVAPTRVAPTRAPTYDAPTRVAPTRVAPTRVAPTCVARPRPRDSAVCSLQHLVDERLERRCARSMCARWRGCLVLERFI